MGDVKEIQDKLSWNKINQLHEAVSNFSKQSFDIKKLWITVEISAMTLLLTLKIDDVKLLLIIAGVILLFFYLLDSMTYYYQDKLREIMAKEQNAIRKRNNISVQKIERTNWRMFRSLINWSHLLYYSVCFILAVSYCLC